MRLRTRIPINKPVNDHRHMVYVVLHVSLDHGSVVVGVYEDENEAKSKREEQPEQFVIYIAPYFAAPMMEP